MTSIDIAIPTKNPDDEVIIESVKALLDSIAFAGLTVNKLHVVDSGHSHELAPALWFQEKCKDEDIELVWENKLVPLTVARKRLINEIETDWFVFLDDDVLVSKYYMKYCWMWTRCKRVGAVIGRKQHHKHLHPTEWVKQRARRAGVHCLLVRSDAIRGLSYPPDITGVYEDEWMRRFIEHNGYRWVFEPYAVFEHENQDRHPPGWEEGVLAGKYGFAPFHRTVLNVPYSVVKRRSPWPYTKRMLGWLYGRYAL